MHKIKDSVATVALLTVLAISGPSIFWFRGHELFQQTSVYHVFDIPDRLLAWLHVFHWAAWSLPLAWFVCVILSALELGRKKRTVILSLYVAIPVAISAIYWTVWELYIAYLAKHIT